MMNTRELVTNFDKMWAGGYSDALAPPALGGSHAAPWPVCPDATVVILSGVHSRFCRGLLPHESIAADVIRTGKVPAARVASMSFVPYDPVLATGPPAWGADHFDASKPNRTPPPSVVRVYAPVLAAYLHGLLHLRVIVTLDRTSHDAVVCASSIRTPGVGHTMLRELDVAEKKDKPLGAVYRTARTSEVRTITFGNGEVAFVAMPPLMSLDSKPEVRAQYVADIAHRAKPEVAVKRTYMDAFATMPPSDPDYPRMVFCQFPGLGTLSGWSGSYMMVVNLEPCLQHTPKTILHKPPGTRGAGTKRPVISPDRSSDNPTLWKPEVVDQMFKHMCTAAERGPVLVTCSTGKTMCALVHAMFALFINPVMPLEAAVARAAARFKCEVGGKQFLERYVTYVRTYPRNEAFGLVSVSDAWTHAVCVGRRTVLLARTAYVAARLCAMLPPSALNHATKLGAPIPVSVREALGNAPDAADAHETHKLEFAPYEEAVALLQYTQNQD